MLLIIESCCVICIVALKILRAYWSVFFFQAEDGIRDLVRSRGLGDVYKRQNPQIIPEALEAQRNGEIAKAINAIRPALEKPYALSLIHI